METLQEIAFNIVLVVFSVSYAYYFERLMREWPLFGRWIRYFYGLGRAYSYGLREIFLVFSFVVGVYIFGGIYIFIISLLEFAHLSDLHFICLCILGYLYIPSLLFTLVRGILQIIIPEDFIKAVEKARDKTSKFKTGLSEEAEDIIKEEIEKKRYFPRIKRVILSLLILASLYLLPWLFKIMEN